MKLIRVLCPRCGEQMEKGAPVLEDGFQMKIQWTVKMRSEAGENRRLPESPTRRRLKA
jgi:hypothetical protein